MPVTSPEGPAATCPPPGRTWLTTAAIVFSLALAACSPAHAATLLVCRVIDLAAPIMAPLIIPAGTLFRDDGRADDPLARFTNDKWQLRLETVTAVTIPALTECARVLVRVTSDSSVKTVSVGDNRSFVYSGSSLIMDAPNVSEDMLTTKGRVLDSVP
jgi:hypothetical protein